MEFDNLLFILSISDSSGVLGILHSDRLFVHHDLDIQEEQDTLDRLISAYNSGHESCIVTSGGTYINSY